MVTCRRVSMMVKLWMLPTIFLVPAVCGASLIANGDFEDEWTQNPDTSWPVPPNWTLASSSNPASPLTGGNQIAGERSALLSGSTGRLDNVFTNATGTRWQFDMDFAVEDAGSDRTLDLSLLFASGVAVHLRVVNDPSDGGSTLGDLQAYHGSWTSLSGLANSVSLDTDDDVSSGVLAVNHLTVTGTFDAASPYYSVTLTNANNDSITAVMVQWFENSQVTGKGISAVRLRTDMSRADYVVDNFSVTNVPEPGTSGLLGVGLMVGLAATGGYRRKRSKVVVY